MPSLRVTAILVVGLSAALTLPALTHGVPDAPEKAAVNDKEFHERLLDVAKTYTTYGRVDDELRWAPELCRMPMPGRVRYSDSSDDATHGRKLYSIFARNRTGYLNVSNPGIVIGLRSLERDRRVGEAGQVIVKESWLPQEVEAPKDRELRREPAAYANPPKPEEDKPTNFADRDHFHPYVTKDGKTYKATKQGELFIMLKVDPKTVGTDEGWVYGTVTPDLKTVTSAGRVASCMKCHETKSGRLFGLPSGQPLKKK
jgi:hypothetical protein